MAVTVGVPPKEFCELAPDAWTVNFWNAARRHELVCAQCDNCGTFRMPPVPFCHVCRSQDTSYPELEGTGTVYSFTIVRHPAVPELRGSVPYVIGVIALDGAPGARLISNVIGVQPDEVRVGLRVTVAWDDVFDDVAVPRFVPLREM
jgi:uncharacterized protein